MLVGDSPDGGRVCSSVGAPLVLVGDSPDGGRVCSSVGAPLVLVGDRFRRWVRVLIGGRCVLIGGCASGVGG